MLWDLIVSHSCGAELPTEYEVSEFTCHGICPMSVTPKEVSPDYASLLVPCYAHCLRGCAACGGTGVPQNSSFLTLGCGFGGVLATGTSAERLHLCC